MKTLILALSLSAACGSSYRAVTPNDGAETFPPRVLLIDGTRSVDEVRLAVSRGLADREYAINNESPQAIAATLSTRRLSLQLDVSYSASQIGIAYAGGSGLLIAESGRCPQYEKLTRALESSIHEALKKPEPEPVAKEPAAPKAAKKKTPPPVVAMFARPLEWEDARAAVRAGLAEHGWVVEKEGAFGSWIVRLDHGDERIRADLELSVVSAEIVYRDSVGMEFDALGRNAQYERWLRNIVTAIEDASRR